MKEPGNLRRPRLAPRAYLNAEFLKSRDARLLRILSEYLEPASRLKWQRVEDTIVFFGSARATSREVAEKRLASARERLEASPQAGLELPFRACEITTKRRDSTLLSSNEAARSLAAISAVRLRRVF